MQKKPFAVLKLIALIALLAVFSSGLAGCLTPEQTPQRTEPPQVSEVEKKELIAERELPEAVELNEYFFVYVYTGARAGTLVETLPENFTYISCIPNIGCVNVPKKGFSASVAGQELTITYSSDTFVILAYKVRAPGSPVTGAAFSGVFKNAEGASCDVEGDTTIGVVESNPQDSS